MDVRSPLFQNIASVLIGILLLNPIMAAAADATLAAANANTSIGVAGNGVPVVNIATPNGNGLSHNQFSDYNVGQQGLILNNATARTQSTQLGGIILGNANLQGQAANLILNEVTGGSPSQLRGYTEVAGQQAHVVVANPNGITCDGCGFINTPRATLSTGRPIVENGRLDRLQVDGGAISIEGEGLNASNIDQFDLITRSAKLNAELHANQLNVVTGANDVKVADLAVSQRAANKADEPQLAIDSSALGGMYAGAIRLVGTEQGVGVKLSGNMAASAGDIQIDANGRLSLAQTVATGNVRIAAESLALNGKVYAGDSVSAQASGALSNQQSLAARNGISLRADEVVNPGVVEAGVNADNSRNGVGDVSIDSQRLRNTGTVAASRTLEVATNGLDNRAGTLSGKAQVRIQAGQLDNRQGRVLSQGSLSVQATTLDNSQAGLINGRNGLSVQSAGLNNQAGEISSQGHGQVTAENLDNRQGALVGESGLLVTVSGDLNNSQGGMLSSNGNLQVDAGNLDNSADGTLVSQGALTATVAGSLDNSRQGTLSSKGSARVEAASLNNGSGGRLVTDGSLLLVAGRVDNGAQGRIAAQGDLNAQVAVFEQRAGELLSQGRLTLVGQRLDNSGAGLLAANQGIDLQVRQIDNRGGEISSRAAVAITADDLDNSSAGTIIGDAGLRLTVARLLNGALGRLLGRDALVVRGASLDNSAGGTLSSRQHLDLALSGDLNNSDDGALVSEGVLNLSARALNNQAGTASSAGNLAVNAGGGLDNRRGKLVSDAELQLASSRLDNSAGTISGKTATGVQTGELINQGGRLLGGTSLTLSAARVDNRNQGLLAAGSTLTATVSELDQRGAGQLVSEGALTLDMQRGVLNNSEHGLLAASGPLLLNTLGAVNNSQGGEISSNRSFVLAADNLNNQGGRVISAQALMLRINQILLNSLGGVLSGAEALSLQAASLDNAGGTVASRGDIGVEVAGALNNSSAGTLSAGGQLEVESASLDNSAQGLLASGGNLLLDSGTIDNHDGQLLSQRALRIASGDIDNRHGVIGSEQTLQLDAARVDNQAGLINSAEGLTLNATTLDSSNQGEVSARQDLLLSVNQLIQRQGRLIAGTALSLDLHDGSLDNRGGLISAQGPLILANLRSLDNRGGELSSDASFLVRAERIDNGDQGRIISAGTLGLEAATLRNAGEGLLSGWQGLDVTGGSLDNSGKGTLSSRDGALGVELSGALNNSAEGALASQGDMQVDAASLDNSDKGILSTEGRLDLTLAGDLDNHGLGLLSAAGAVAIQARDVNNGAGQITGHSLLLTGHNLDNGAGQLSSDTVLNLNLLGALNNTQQAQLASGANLLLRAGAVDNRGGTLVSRGLLDVIASSFNNSAGGTLAAQQALTIALGGALDNSQDGLIYSLDDQLRLQAGSANNNAGTLQGKGDLELEVTGALSNQQGRISSGEGNVKVQAASLDNSAAGMLYGIAGWLRLTVAGLFNNNDGVTQARALEIQSGDLNNAAGHLSATHGDSRIAARAFNNQGGGLYAGQLLDLTASSFDNQHGQVAAATVDFGLGGALNNSGGIIESSSTLQLVSASLFNGNGRLRALGMQGDTLIRSGTLDNRLGILESANSNLKLELDSLLNADGRIQHVGSGTLQLASALATTAGGTLASNGQLSISTQNWVNSGILQAARLLLNVDQFSQTVSGQLLASESLTASGDTWNNEGLLASDGTLSLTLTGTYSGNGTLSSLDDLSLTAGSVSLGTNGRISGGALTTLNSFGAVTNHGRLTSAGDLRISAGSLNNYGTLGSGENLRLAAANLLNEYGLIFSGADMALRVSTLINNQADIYSMDTLSIARDDAQGLLNSLENRSGSIESLADMTLRAALLSNRKDSFSTAKNQTYGHISVVCYDCSGDHHNVDYVATERFDIAVAEDSVAASIHSGGDLDIQGSDVVNRYSSLSASGDILISAATLENTGAATGTLERVRRFNTGRITDGTDYRFRDRYIHPYNAQPLPKEVPDALYRWTLVSDIETSTPTGIASAAIIQAGGNVVIQASQSLSNQSILAYQAPQAGTVQRVATGVSAASQPLQVTLNPQLPADLAQQQVNPLTLPGFSLPQGQNGLFRLSDQQGESAQQADVQHGVRDLTLGGPSIAATAFEQSLGHVDAQGRVFGSPGADAAVAAAQESLPVAGGEPLPGAALPASAHRYLIETNPALTSLKAFLGTDYLLNLLGYDLDGVQRRLGDAFYEQRLIREAVTARTGQRFLAGLTSDEAMFRYLMDNAIASKSALNLSLGVTLTAGQIAALTHDIVWLEEHEVLGQKVLVPVLYLAQAEGRLAPNGALIQGRDVALLSGGSLTNSGTLRASRDLSVTANAIGNSGLMQAGERLSLLATGSIRNALGGIIAGRDVSAIALTGDIINERSITHEARSGRGFSQLTSVVDKAAGIEASNALVLSAGRDIQNIGGRLQAGGDATLSAGRDLVIASAAAESGSMRKDKRHFWETTSTTQYGSDVQVGGDLEVQADNDLAVVASTVKARGDIAFAAGNDVTIASAANEASSEYRYKSSRKKIAQENSSVRQQASVIEAGGDLLVAANNDLTLRASQLRAADNVSLQAGGDLSSLAAANQDYSFYERSEKKKGSFGKSSSKSLQRESATVRQQGVEIEAGADLEMIAGNNLVLSASQLKAGGEAYLYAGHDLALTTAQDSDSSYYAKSKSSSSGFSSSQKMRMDSSRSTTQVGSLVSADTVVIQAGQDLGVIGSDVASTRDTYLGAGRNVLIDGALETSESSHAQSKKKSGLLSSGGIGFTLGSASTKATQTNHAEQTRASTVGSVLGDVQVQAGKELTIRGSDLVAGRDIQLSGQNVNILAAQNDNRSGQTYKTKTSGLTLALSGTVGSAIDSAYQTAQQARSEDDSRLSALQGIKAGLTGVQAWQAAQQGGGLKADNAGQFFGISASLGSQKSSSRQIQEQSVSQGSSLSAGNNLSIRAGGSEQGQDGDIRIQGSQLKAGNDLLLDARRDILLEAAANTQKLDGKNKSSGGAVGISLGVGPQGGGLSVFANANQGAGKEKGNGTVWSESTLDAGRQVTLVSGRDTTLKGAQVSGERIVADVGRDLSLQSLQDSDDYNSRQKNVSGGASVTLGSGGSANLSINQSKLESNYRSVREQTGLYAGQGGFQIEVGQHTQLDGAVLASTAETERNRLSTGTLGWSDIRNKADYQSQQQSVSVSGGNSSGAGGFTGNMPSGMLVAYSHGDSASGTTRSAISDGVIDIRDTATQQQAVASLSRDVEHANGSISPIFDKEKEQRRLQQVQLIAEIGNQSMDILRTQGELNADKAAREELARQGNGNPSAEQIRDSAAYKRIMGEYGTGSDLQRAAQAITAALQGLAGGDIGSALAGASAPYLAHVIKQQTEGNKTAQVMAHAVLGAVVANAQGNSAAAGAAGAATGEAMAMLISKALYGGVASDQLSEEQKQTVSALATLAAGMAGAAAGGDAAAALAGAQGGKNAVENNWLSTQQKADYAQELAEAETLLEKLAVMRKWNAISLSQNVESSKGIAQGVAEGLAGTGLETLNGMALFMRDPVEQWDNLKDLASTDAVKQVLGAAYDSFQQDLREIDRAIEYGGDQNAQALGYKIGSVLSTVVAAIATGGSAKTASLSKVGITLKAEQAGELAASAGQKIPSYLERIKKTGYDEDVPLVDGAKGTGNAAPKITIREHYDHHLNMVDDVKDQLTAQGYSVSPREISFGSSCGVGRCRPDIVAKAPDGTVRIIEIKTGGAGLSVRQSEIFPQIRDGGSIPRGDVAREFGLIPGKPLKEQGYPNGIPIEELHFPGAKK